MSDDALHRATLALRAAVGGNDAPAEQPTLARVLRTVKRARQRRRLTWIVALQLAVGGVAVGAWAARSGALGLLKRRLFSVAGTVPSARVVDPPSRGVIPPPPERPPEEFVEASTPLTQRTQSARRHKKPPPARAQVETTPVVATAPTVPNLSVADLYQRAHEAHFQRRDFAAALVLWNRYLELGGGAPLIAEARFNRAMARWRVGQRAGAIADLRPFADGDYGSYRRDEARALLRRLADAPYPSSP